MRKALLSVLAASILILSIIATLSVPRAYSQLPLPPGVSRKDVVIFDILHGRSPAPDNFNVWVIGAIPRQGYIHPVCVDTLWYLNHSDPHGGLVNVLAAAPPQYEEGYTKLIVKLKQGVYWSDGVEFTADDVVFTIKAHLQNPNLAFSSIVK